MATKNWNGFKKSGDTYIPNDATARAGVIANTKLIKDTVGWSGKNKGQWINKSLGGDATTGYKLDNGGSSLIAKVNQNTSYTVSRKHGQGNRFRIVGFVNEPSSVASLSSEQLYSNNSTDTYTVNSGSYNYLVFTYDSATTISQDTAEAMICDADILDFTYEPYFGSTAVDWASYAKTGTVNILNNTLTDGENNNVIWTVDDKKVVTVNTGTGGASANTFLNFDIKIPKGKWVFRGTNGQTGGSDSTYYMRLRKSDGSKPSASEAIPASIESINGSETEFEVLVDELSIRCNICIYSAAGELSNLKFYPMIAPRGYKGDYAPYAMTNRELTDKVANYDAILPSSTDLNNITKTGFYFCNNVSTNTPSDITANYFGLLVFSFGGSAVRQVIVGTDCLYVRSYGGSPATWKSWYKFTGTVVS